MDALERFVMRIRKSITKRTDRKREKNRRSKRENNSRSLRNVDSNSSTELEAPTETNAHYVNGPVEVTAQYVKSSNGGSSERRYKKCLIKRKKTRSIGVNLRFTP